MRNKTDGEAVKLPTNFSFGLFFAVIFIALATWAFSKDLLRLSLMAAFSAIIFLAATLFFSKVLSPLNHLWYQFGIMLGNIVNPIILGFIYFFLISPISFFARLFGRDELKMGKQFSDTFWVDRSPKNISPDSFKNQY